MTSLASSLGDPWPLLALTALLALWLDRREGRAAAGAWLLTILGCLGSVVVMKTAGYAAHRIFALGDRPFTISGHAAFAACVYGGVVLACVRRARAASADRRGTAYALATLAGAAALVLTLAVGHSRVAIRAHTPAEVAAGIAVGWLAHLLTAGPGRRIAARRSGALIAGFAAVALVWSGLMLAGLKTELILKDLGERVGAALSTAASARGR